MATLRIVRCTGASFNSAAIDGVVRAGWQDAPVKRVGRSDGEVGNTSIDKTFHRVTGFVEIDSFSDAADGSGQPETLMSGTAGALVINWVAAGGTAKTITFDNVVFVGSSPARIGSGEEGGTTTRVQVQFIAKFVTADSGLADIITVA